MKIPMIGVIPLWDAAKESVWMLPGYLHGIEEAGGFPVVLPLTESESLITEMAASFDGFLFTGGHDVSPGLYNEKTTELCGETCPSRDSMEALLFRAAVLGLNKPAFGICRGIQFFNAILGGTLYQDIPAQFKSQQRHVQAPPYDRPLHYVNIESSSPLFELLKAHSLAVNSYHHQGIKELSPSLETMAVSEDGLIEAVYMPDKPFVWAVQWHPEFWLKDKSSRQLFEAFVNACREECLVNFT